MRKRMFFAIILSLFVADFAAIAATRRVAVVDDTPVASRASSHRAVPESNTTAPGVMVRAANKQTVQQKTSNPVAARAGATQKVVNMGTKVDSATENTTIPKECQDAFFGCMDAFCMLDNVSGGRCQCNDRIVQLNQVLDDIMKLDNQTYLMSTEGVERIQMGEAEEQIMARTKSMADTVTANKSDNKKKARTLDLSALTNNDIFGDTDFDNIFGGDEKDALSKKQGNALYKEVSGICNEKIPAQCKTHYSMLEMLYAQKIKSDCTAYENSLKQQKNQSQQKLYAAQKSLRDAALDEYNSQNKYKTTGECAIAFTECMKTTAECGDDYSGCVTFSANENLQTTKSKTKARKATIKGAVPGADITLTSSTMEQLLAKKPMCEHVTKRCVNVNKNDAVWNVFLKNAATALKSAELAAEQDLRYNCATNVVDCYKKACKTNFGDGDSYDACLANPELYKSLCKVQLEPCLAATGGSLEHPENSSLWEGLVASLNAVKVDTCTKQVKSCLTERCGEDFSECIGLDTETIAELCPYQKLTACMSATNSKTGKKMYEDKEAIQAYVAQIAQGLALQIDNALAVACQNALDEAMIRVCGSAENCNGFVMDENTGTRSFEYKVCKYDSLSADGVHFTSDCRTSVDAIGASETAQPDGQGWAGKLSGIVYWGDIEYRQDKNGNYGFTTINEYIEKLKAAGQNISEEDEEILRDMVYGSEIRALENSVNATIHAIESDPKVTYCMTGRQIEGFDGAKFGKQLGKKYKGREVTKEDMRFPNLTNMAREIIANSALQQARKNYNKKYDEEIQRMMQDQAKMTAELDKQQAENEAAYICYNWANQSALPTAKAPNFKKSNIGIYIAMGVVAVATVVLSIYTFGAAGAAGAAAEEVLAGYLAANAVGMASTAMLETAVTLTAAELAATAVGVAGIAAGAGAATGLAFTLGGTAEVNNWNYREKVTTKFNKETGECTKITTSTNCAKPKPKKQYCKKWEDPKESKTTINLF